MERKTQQQTLDSIRDQHKMLLSRIEEPEGVDVEQVNTFLSELAQAGAAVEKPEDRSMLNELLRYWSSIVNDKTGKFPVIQLLPSDFQTQSSKRLNGWKVAALVLLLLTLLLGGTTGVILVAQRTHVSITPTPTPTHVSITPTPTALADGLIVTNIRLTCSGCNDPVQVTISTIQIDNANGRMIWNTVLKDITGSGRGFSIAEYGLQASGSQTMVAAVLTQTQFSGNQADMQAIFAFVPFHHVTYTLTIVVKWSDNINITFDPAKITF